MFECGCMCLMIKMIKIKSVFLKEATTWIVMGRLCCFKGSGSKAIIFKKML